ncbi:MAG: class I SAM-dependent methyltransferase [Anaerolineae bacterium]
MKICLACQQRFESADWDCPVCHWTPQFRHGYPIFAPNLAGNFAGFEAQLFSILAEIEAGHFWFEARNQLLIWSLQRYFPQARNFLEIGCGTGFVLSGLKREYSHLVLSGSDIFMEGLAFAQARLPQATLWQMDARSIPFEAEFDVIGAFDVLEHIVEDETVLRQIFCALKPGGGIMVTVPQHPFLWSYFDDLSHHQRRYIRSNLLSKMEQVGFKICKVTSFVTFLLPILLLTRWRQRHLSDNYDVKAEFEHSWLVNTALKKVMDFERGLIKQGFSFPAGGSLLVVAQR